MTLGGSVYAVLFCPLADIGDRFRQRKLLFSTFTKKFPINFSFHYKKLVCIRTELPLYLTEFIIFCEISDRFYLIKKIIKEKNKNLTEISRKISWDFFSQKMLWNFHYYNPTEISVSYSESDSHENSRKFSNRYDWRK